LNQYQNNYVEWGIRGMHQAVQALNSNPSTTKPNKQKNPKQLCWMKNANLKRLQTVTLLIYYFVVVAFVLLFWDKVSVCSQVGLEFMIHLPLPPKWDYRDVAPCLVYMTFVKIQNYSEREEISSCQRLRFMRRM
jgi:hypothetical protein